MKEKLRVMVADYEISRADKIKLYLEEKEENLEVRTLDDGEQAYHTLKEWEPDVAVLDLKLKHMGGLEIMEELKKENITLMSSVYLLSSEGADDLAQKASKLGVSYFLLRPCHPENIYRRIVKKSGGRRGCLIYPEEELKQLKQEKQLEEAVTQMIRELGIPAHIKGYHYIRDSIILAVNDMQILNYITKLLYPTIAKKYKTTSSSVERAIRHAIEVAFTRGKDDLLDEMFGYKKMKGKTKPTNSEFIALIADKLKIEQYASF